MEAKRQGLRQILAANIKEQRKILKISQEKLAEAKKPMMTFNGIYTKITQQRP